MTRETEPQFVREAETLITDLLAVWDPEWEPGKGLHKRAIDWLEDLDESRDTGWVPNR